MMFIISTFVDFLIFLFLIFHQTFRFFIKRTLELAPLNPRGAILNKHPVHLFKEIRYLYIW